MTSDKAGSGKFNAFTIEGMAIIPSMLSLSKRFTAQDGLCVVHVSAHRFTRSGAFLHPWCQ